MLYFLVLFFVSLTIGISTGFGQSLGVLIDPPSFIVVLVLPLTMTLLAGQLGDLKRAFNIQIAKVNIYTKSELKLALHAIKSFSAYLFTSAAFGTALGIVVTLAKTNSWLHFSKSLSVSSLMLFYAIVIQLIIRSVPAKIERILIELEGSDD